MPVQSADEDKVAQTSEISGPIVKHGKAATPLHELSDAATQSHSKLREAFDRDSASLKHSFTKVASQDSAEPASGEAVDTSSAHLPDVRIPIGLDRSVVDARKELEKLAQGKVGTTTDQSNFKANIKTFEQRADREHLSPDQVAQTFKNLGYVLQPAGDSSLTSAQREQLALQWMKHLAHPSGTTRTGWHDTCGWALLEERLLTKDPEKITEKFAQVVTTGNVTTLDIAAAQKMADAGDTTGGVPIKVFKLDESSLKPDQEATNISTHADRRDYADQIAQVMESNISWEAKTKDPKGENVPAGSMQFHQAETVARPEDSQTNGQRLNKSGESVAYIDPATHKKMVEDANGFGFGGAASTIDISTVNAVISGRAEKFFLEKSKSGEQHVAETPVFNMAQLHSQLQLAKKEGQFPIGIVVQPDKPGIVEDYLARSPLKSVNDVPKHAWHAIAVTGIDTSGRVKVYNPWGINKTFTEAELYKAMND